MDKLVKIGSWIWAKKERIVLGVLVLVLVFQVYSVLMTPPTVEVQMPPSPVATQPDPIEAPPPPPNPGADKDYSTLHVRNPFWYWSSREGGVPGASAEEIDLTLLRVQPGQDGAPSRVRIKSPSGQKWYQEGDSIDGDAYKIVRIDSEKKEAEVFATKQNKTIVLRAQGR